MHHLRQRPVRSIAIAVRSISSGIAGLAGLLTLPSQALAHVVPGPIGGFSGGFEHPLTGPDHLMAMFAVGLWGALLGGRSVWALPVAFPMVMVGGGIAGMAGLALPYAEIGIALSMLVLGTAIAAKWRPPIAIPLFLVAVFAVFHGYAHGVELPQAADPVTYATGFVLATGSIHVAGIVVGILLAKPFHGLLARALGGIIAAGGLYYLLG
jgi:urease accessory protein